ASPSPWLCGAGGELCVRSFPMPPAPTRGVLLVFLAAVRVTAASANGRREACGLRRHLHERTVVMATQKTIGILGASGYTGAELVRLLLRHPRVELSVLTADRRAGQTIGDVFPQLAPYDLPRLVAIDAVDWAAAKLDLVFCALPHAT